MILNRKMTEDVPQPYPPDLCRDREELARSYLARKQEQKPGVNKGALLWAAILLTWLAAVLLSWLW